VPKIEEGPLYKYEEPEFINNGPRVPKLEDIESGGFCKYIRLETPAEKASGFQTKISCMRALQEAMQSLFSG
jgi:CDK-activating kinase assembly factor MAT1